MTQEQIKLQNQMANAANSLHHLADELVNSLEGSVEMNLDTPAGDNARDAYEGARRWRALVEGGEA